MEKAGIDVTKFKAHYVRAAAGAQAVQAEVPIQTVKLHAGWSLRTSTFEEIHLKPREQHVRGLQFLEIMFALYGKVSTSEVEWSHTTAVLGTTRNC